MVRLLLLLCVLSFCRPPRCIAKRPGEALWMKLLYWSARMKALKVGLGVRSDVHVSLGYGLLSSIR